MERESNNIAMVTNMMVSLLMDFVRGLALINGWMVVNTMVTLNKVIEMDLVFGSLSIKNIKANTC